MRSDVGTSYNCHLFSFDWCRTVCVFVVFPSFVAFKFKRTIQSSRVFLCSSAGEFEIETKQKKLRKNSDQFYRQFTPFWYHLSCSAVPLPLLGDVNIYIRNFQARKGNVVSCHVCYVFPPESFFFFVLPAVWAELFATCFSNFSCIQTGIIWMARCWMINAK